MNSSPLAAGVADAVAHLHGATLDDLFAGRVVSPIRTPTPVPEVSAVDRRVGAGHGVAVRRYELTDRTPGTTGQPRPGVVWAHGGAWIAGDLDMPEADAVARRLCAALDAVVLSVDYRLAPGATHPAAVDDIVAAFEALVGDGTVDPHRIVLGGASAGGHLAAVAAQRLRDRAGHQPAAMFLAYPATDPDGGPYPVERPDLCPELMWFDRETTFGAFSLYLGGVEPADDNVPADGRLDDLPPTLVTTSEFDALADQAIRYTRLLTAAGVEADNVEVAGVLHGYLDLVGTLDVADRALDAHISWLAARLDPPHPDVR